MTTPITIKDLGLTTNDIKLLIELAKCIKDVIKTDGGNVIVFKDNTVIASEKSLGIISTNNIVISSGNTLHLNPDKKHKINKMMLEDTNVLNNDRILLEKTLEYKERDMLDISIKVLDYNLRDGYSYITNNNIYTETMDRLMVMLMVNYGNEINIIEVPLYNTRNINKWRNIETDKSKPELEIIERLGLPKPGHSATIRVRPGDKLIKNDIREYFTGRKSMLCLDEELVYVRQPRLFNV